MSSQRNVFPIKSSEIEEFKEKVEVYLKGVSWKPKKPKQKDVMTMNEKESYDFIRGKHNGNTEESINILEIFERFTNSSDLMSENANKVANTILYGLALAGVTARIYGKSSGLENLRNINRNNEELSSDQNAELGHKNQTDAAVFVFTASNYIVSELLKYKKETVDKRVSPKVDIPELVLTRKEKAIQCTLFYYGAYVQSSEFVSDDVMLVKFTIEYFTKILDEIGLFKSSLQYAGFFDGQSYEVESTGFLFKGFYQNSTEEVHVKEINPLRFEEIVGNRLSKLETIRMAQRLATYDMKTQRNPIMVLRGLTRTHLYMGIPGTGKTMFIRATVTFLTELCKELGIKFKYHPLSLNIISKFQGESVDRMDEWMIAMNDPSCIVYAPIDDAESVFARRDGDNNSEGNSSVVKVFLNRTEGADAGYDGQNVMCSFTNNVEIMDPAVLSRYGKRTYILGAETMEDYLDQTYLYFTGMEKNSPGLVKYAMPKDYKYMTNQQLLKSYSAGVREEDTIPKNEKLRDLYHRLSKEYDPMKNPEFVAEFAIGTKRLFPNMWGNRDMRNVYDGVSDKLMDFDYPEDWMNDIARFYAKTYDEKLGMLTELRNNNLKGISFERLLLQELVKYADIAIMINDTAHEKAVKDQMERMLVYKEAEERIAGLKKVA